MWNLVADVGGTNMRLAVVSAAGVITDQQTVPSKGGPNFLRACADFITAQPSAPASVAVAAAGVVVDGAVRLTNSKQRFNEGELARVCQTDSVKILNDFEAAAWSLATVTDGDVQVLQGPRQIAQGPRLIIGPGTGLGVGAMDWFNGDPHVIPGEGGHVTLAPHSAEELAYFETLATLWPEVQIGQGLAVEAEAILSGTGLPMFYNAIAITKGAPQRAEKTAEVVARSQSREDACATRALDLFRRYLGQIAGDLALVFNATGGVFVSGGVIHKNPWLLDRQFLDAFNAGGRHSDWRARIPVYLYQNPDFGLLGARNYLSTCKDVT